MSARIWTNDEIALIREMHAASKPVSEIRVAVKHGYEATRKKMHELGLTMKRGALVTWAETEDNVLRIGTSSGTPVSSLCGILNRAESSVRSRIRTLNLNIGHKVIVAKPEKQVDLGRPPLPVAHPVMLDIYRDANLPLPVFV